MKEEKKIDKKLKKFKKETNELREELINFVLKNYKGENVITDYLKGDLHIDIYLPELKLGFKMLGLYENSLQYSTNKAQLQQLKYAKERDIHLVQIFSDEWINKNNINMIISCIKIKSNRHFVNLLLLFIYFLCFVNFLTI